MKEAKKNNPFKTPEGYFENFTGKLLNALNEEKVDFPQETGFAVPDDYFDELPNNIAEKITAKETEVIRLKPYKKYFIAAASVAAIALIALSFNWNYSEKPTFDELADSDIEAYFENNEYDLSAYEIAEVLPIDELEINDILTENINEKILVDYLDEHIKDFEELNLDDYE